MATILLLEDNVELRTLLQQALELSNHTILTASTGLEGLSILGTSETIPNAIICDVNMPEMDGVTFIQHVRNKPEWSKIYIIILTGRDDYTSAQECGADVYVQKPFSVIALNRLLDQHIGS
jgi:CheY-like chemotaxis protein